MAPDGSDNLRAYDPGRRTFNHEEFMGIRQAL
jgi:hypothetical protein